MKKILTIIIMVFLVSPGLFADNTVGGEDMPWDDEPLEGDVNNDGKVDILDIATLVSLLDGKTDRSKVPYPDVNNDTKVDTNDLLRLKEIILKQQ